jgi:peptidyl-prolyl cis-trans isomerase B (cyclophilin B)
VSRSSRSARRAALAALALAAALAGCSPREQVAEIEVDGYGTIRFRFLPDAAPGHVENFKKLAREAFYDGTTFHRVAPGLMIEGGDPNSKDADPANDGLGGPGYSLPAEPSGVPHAEGTVSMAAEDSGSSGSRFFIVLRSHDDLKDQLDGRSTVFGQVFEGIEVARRIAWAPRDENDRPLQPVLMTRVRIVEAHVPR